tara:strand:- start:1917 stop:2132 length:216 start_codon:yes stop_codon:yes gene_type:complete
MDIIMSHSVEEYYKRCAVLHEKALQLHRERFKKTGEFDSVRCNFLLDDIKALARSLAHSDVNMDIDFGKQK